MMNRRNFLLAGGAGALAVTAGWQWLRPAGVASAAATPEHFPVTHSEDEWRSLLTPAQFYVLRSHGTEPPNSSPLEHETRKGTFACAGCDQPVYRSETKFESGTGWPSFWEPIKDAVGTSADRSFFMTRTEVHCSNCGGHLGHVFADGPPPSGMRYCMNGVAMVFHADATS
jgi:peptide-methionine (R)-S-oxide reductase